MSLNHLIKVGNNVGSPPALAICTKSIQMLTNPIDGYVLTSDANGNATWQSPSGGAERVLRLLGTNSAVDVSDVSTIIAQNPLQPVTLVSLKNGIDGQWIQMIADQGSTMLIKNNTSVGSDQPFYTMYNADITIPTPAIGLQLGTGYAVYDAQFTGGGRWIFTTTTPSS